MTSDAVIAMAYELMEKHEIDTIWNFKFDNAKRRVGFCSYRYKTISLSRHFVPLLKEHEIRDTILHEIAHALVGKRNGHNNVWKAKALEIGCNGQRLYCGEAKVKPKYKGVCPECGRIIYRHKRKRISCGKCSKVFNPKHEFVWSLNE